MSARSAERDLRDYRDTIAQGIYTLRAVYDLLLEISNGEAHDLALTRPVHMCYLIELIIEKLESAEALLKTSQEP
ncbi:MAG: hypothetical protein H2045_10595 [Rhizobiales bacterium]|nr:hypothetical protein [Hyphomicrobiales bacterium]